VGIKIIELVNTDDEFYPTLGPYLARRDVHAYLGGPLWDDAAKTWFVALDAGQVAGFAAVASRRRKLYLESLYLSDDANETTGQQLVRTAMRRYKEHTLYVTVRRDHTAPYAESGFVQVGETAKFVSLVHNGKEK
jgi:hypothetical protein